METRAQVGAQIEIAICHGNRAAFPPAVAELQMLQVIRVSFYTAVRANRRTYLFFFLKEPANLQWVIV
jgi:hypothetical protein